VQPDNDNFTQLGGHSSKMKEKHCRRRIMTTLTITLTAAQTTVTLPAEQGQIVFSKEKLALPDHGVQIPVQAGHLAPTAETAAEYITITLPWSTEPTYVERFLQARAEGAALALPANQETGLADYLQLLDQLLTRFGIQSGPAATPKPTTKKPMKARHRFDKALVNEPFHVARNGSRATVYWTKRNEMTIKAGATLTTKLPLNRDGSLRYGTKYGQKLRDDHAAAIADHRTTADVHLRSVNEVGLFLYFGDTNGWLELINDRGQTLDELTRVD
jgi:hypothetical protein